MPLEKKVGAKVQPTTAATIAVTNIFPIQYHLYELLGFIVFNFVIDIHVAHTKRALPGG